MTKKLQTLTAPNEMLLKKTMKVKIFDEVLSKFSQDMIHTAAADNIVGLSSVQVVNDERFSYDALPPDHRAQPNVIYIKTNHYELTAVNIELLESSEETNLFREGCVSIPEMYAKIERATHIKVKFQDLSGQEHIKDYSNYDARVFLHEIDHSKGILFPHRLPKFKQALFWKDYHHKKNMRTR